MHHLCNSLCHEAVGIVYSLAACALQQQTNLPAINGSLVIVTQIAFTVMTGNCCDQQIFF
jgi:uncharacterized membrane protein YkvI